MELYIGGYAQGKLNIVKEKYPMGTVIGPFLKEPLPDGHPLIWNDFHLSVKEYVRTPEDEHSFGVLIDKILSESPDLIIISDEIGNGLIPMDAGERFYRDACGRILIDLAARAKGVARVVCGIPMKIK